jgi:hypothetical protein
MEGAFEAPAVGGTQAAPAADYATSYAAALQAAMDAPTPQAKEQAMNAMAALAKQRTDARDAGAGNEQTDTDNGEAFAPPESPVGYRFEHHLPPNVDIVNEEALGAFKSGLHGLGVPASIAAGAFADVARLHGEGAFASDDAYQAAAQVARQHMDRVHGEAAPAAIRDAMAFLDRAEKAGHLTSDVVDAIMASPIALSQAAMLARHGSRKR